MIIYNKSMSSKKVEVCDKKLFEAFLESKTLKENLSVYRKLLADIDAEKDPAMLAVLKKSKKELKATLFPLFLPQCSEFRDNLRCKENAVEGSFVTGDYDHCGIDLAAYISELKERVDFKKEGVVFAEVSVGGDGMHVWALAREGETVLDAQMRLETLVGLKRDTAMDRIYQGSLLSGEVLYYDEELMWSDEGKVAFMPLCETASSADIPCGMGNVAPVADGDDSPLVLNGVPYKLIVERLQQYLGMVDIVEGVRHNKLMSLAMILRNICDHNPLLLARILPQTNPPLPDWEIRDICMYACKNKRDYRVSKVLCKVLDELGVGVGACPAEEVNVVEPEINVLPKMPRLPKLFKVFANLCQPEYRAVMTMALFPPLGTLATGLRGVYNVNELEYLNFQTIIIGPQASCKSRVLKIATDSLLRKMREEEKLMWAIEQEFKEQLRLGQRRKKGKKGSDTDSSSLQVPKTCIRTVPATSSLAQLMYRMQKAEGKHLFSMEAEIGTVVNTNRSGAWASKKEVYKKAFDNEEHGQDYRNEDSFSTVCEVKYNLLFAGTYSAVMSFYDKNSANDGLVTRTMPVFMPDNFGGKRPVFKSLSDKDAAYVDSVVDLLTSLDEEIRCPKIQRSIDKWLDGIKEEAVQTNSEALNVFCHRSATMGFRAGMLAYILEGRKESKLVVDFAVWVAEYVLRNQVRIWGESLDDAALAVQPSKRNIYKMLGDEFTFSDLKIAMGNNPTNNAVSVVISRWKKAELVEKIGPETYRKAYNKS